MLEYSADAFKLLRSKIGRRIVILVFIQIFFIIISLIIVSYYQSQMTYLGNSINMAGKNRFLSSNLMYDTAEFFLGNSSDISNINSGIKELETNILTLKQGGKISDIELKPLPDEFSNDWDNIYQKWILLKTTLTNNILKESQTRSSMVVKVVASETSAPSSLSLSYIIIIAIIRIRNKQHYKNNKRERSITSSKFLKCLGYKIRRIC